MGREDHGERIVLYQPLHLFTFKSVCFFIMHFKSINSLNIQCSPYEVYCIIDLS